MMSLAALAVLNLYPAVSPPPPRAPGQPPALTPASGPAAPCIRRPEARAGPYRVLVEQVTASEYLQQLLGPGAGPAPTGRRSAHLQLRLVADSADAGAAVELFAIQSLTVEADGRRLDVPHYGGPLENADDAVLRAYAYAGDVGMATKEIRSIEGEVIA